MHCIGSASFLTRRAINHDQLANTLREAAHYKYSRINFSCTLLDNKNNINVQED